MAVTQWVAGSEEQQQLQQQDHLCTEGWKQPNSLHVLSKAAASRGGHTRQQRLTAASSRLALQLHPVADVCGCYTRSVGLSCSTAVQLLPGPATDWLLQPTLCLFVSRLLQTRLVCQQPSAGDALQPGKPWLLNALRLAIHFRRGDIATNSRWSHRMFPPTYYINLAQQITQVRPPCGGLPAKCRHGL
jgi:hypothetical protein